MFWIIEYQKAKTAIAFWRCLKKPNIFCSSALGTYHSHLQDLGNHTSLTWKLVQWAKNIKSEKSNEEGEDEKGFVTLVRFIEDNPIGKPTALLYCKILPEEDAVCAPFVHFSTYNCYQKWERKMMGAC